MVVSTRARCYKCEPASVKSTVHRPVKRLRLHHNDDVYQTCPSSCDSNDGILRVYHDLPISECVPDNSSASHAEATTNDAQFQLEDSTTVEPPSLCSSMSTCLGTFEGESPLYATHMIRGDDCIPTTSKRVYTSPTRVTTRKRAREEPSTSPYMEASSDTARPTARPKQYTPAVSDEATGSGSNTNVNELRSQARESSRVLSAYNNAGTLGPAISPPLAPRTPPPEFVYGHVVNPEFGEEVQRAYRMNRFTESMRRDKYGVEVVERWKRGSTPEEDRERWKLACATALAEWEEYSDSD